MIGKSLRVCLLIVAAFAPVMPVGSIDAQPPGVTIALNTNRDPLKRVAVMPMVGALGDSVRTIVHRDLDYSDAVTPIKLDGNDRTPYLEANRSLSYAMFEAQGIQFVVDLVPTGAGLHAALYDVAGKKVRWQNDYDVPDEPLRRDWRLRMHVISDDIVEQITGVRGIAATRIAMTCPQNSINTVCIIDSDGASNVWVPVDSGAYSAAWHPSGDTLVYNTIGGNPQIKSVALRTGASRTLLPAERNVTYITPRFAPDGQTLYYTRSDAGSAHVYRLSLSAGARPQKLTPNGSRDNVQVSVGPNGSHVAFMSNRSGHNEVYTMRSDGTEAKLVLNWQDAFSEKAERNEPDYSPDGRFIALSAQRDGIGKYQIMVVNVAMQTAEAVTSESVNEQPSWAPDNRHIVYTSNRTGVRQLWIVDIVSGRTRQLTHNSGSKLAAWSPRLVPR